MALQVYSLFYYGIEITSDTMFLNFKEGAGAELTTTLDVKGYTLTDIARALQTNLNDIGLLDYLVSVDRSTRKITIDASGPFTILGSSGSNASQSGWPVLGFNPTDVTGSSLSSDTALGKAYSTTFPIQDYVPKEHNKKALNAVVNKSASGRNVSVQSFGEERFIKGNLRWITNEPQPPGFLIRSDSQAVEKLLDFLDWAILIERIEFMEDESNVDNFSTVILASTPSHQDGTGYELREYLDQSLPGWFETGTLVFKVVN